MGGKRTFRLIVCGLILTGSYSAGLKAAPPWASLVSLKEVEADPDKTYVLTEENGPWMIMACSFSGEGAEKQAQDLVYELRTRYKMPAYIHKVRFDLGDASGLGLDRYGSPVKMRYRKGSEVKEVAVLVGDYTAVDDEEAQKVLKKLKYTMPKCLDVKETTRDLSIIGRAKDHPKHYGQCKQRKRTHGPRFHNHQSAFAKRLFCSPRIRSSGDRNEQECAP